MKNQKFNEAIDEIVEFIVDVNKLQMDQLKCNIKAVYEANAHEVDPHTIAKMILDTPVDLGQATVIGIRPAQPAIHLKNEMVCTAEKGTLFGEVGDLQALSYVKVGREEHFGKDFYHHCPERDYQLIRLNYVNDSNIHACPVCNQTFK